MDIKLTLKDHIDNIGCNIKNDLTDRLSEDVKKMYLESLDYACSAIQHLGQDYMDEVSEKLFVIPLHPGKILKNLLFALEINEHQISEKTNVPILTIMELMNEVIEIDEDTAKQLGSYIANEEFWINAQNEYVEYMDNKMHKIENGE